MVALLKLHTAVYYKTQQQYSNQVTFAFQLKHFRTQ